MWGWGGSIVEDVDACRTGHQVGAVETAVDAQRLAQSRGTAAEQAVVVDACACRAHPFEAGKRLQGADQHAVAGQVAAADGVAVPVHAIDEIHVQMPGRTEHGGVARGLAAEGVGGRIQRAAIGLYFDDAPAATINGRQDLVEQFGRHHARIALVEVAG